MKDAKIISHCLLCSAPTKVIQDFGSTPLANEFTQEQIKNPDTFPLILIQCTKCDHFQLNCIVNPERLFKNYHYKSGVSNVNIKHFNNYANKIIKDFHLKYEDLIVDIGSNDFLFLNNFNKHGIQTLGVDPATNLVNECKEKGYNAIEGFFNKDLANSILAKYGKASIITANNIFAHNSNLNEILDGVNVLLSKYGSFIIEVSDFGKVLDNNCFDLIYAEHIMQWTLKPLIEFYSKFNLKVYNVEHLPNHGGSLRVYACRQDNIKYSSYKLTIEDLITQNQIDCFKNDIYKLRENLTDILYEAYYNNKTIGIYGYSAKATTSFNYFRINEKYISNIYDDEPLKIGKWTPNSTHKVKPTSDIYKDKPDYLLILSWNFAPNIISKHKEFKGKWIVPLPELKII